MKFPLNNLDDCNYYHYCLQLSTYAYIIESYNPDFSIEDLVLVHFDHNDNMTVYHLPYLRKEVERMLSYYEKEHLLQERRLKNKRIEYQYDTMYSIITNSLFNLQHYNGIN